jgi:hypothetical protein
LDGILIFLLFNLYIYVLLLRVNFQLSKLARLRNVAGRITVLTRFHDSIVYGFFTANFYTS